MWRLRLASRRLSSALRNAVVLAMGERGRLGGCRLAGGDEFAERLHVLWRRGMGGGRQAFAEDGQHPGVVT